MKNLILLIIVFMFTTHQIKSQHIESYEHQVGIVLSGGGALGFAHIGALQALEERNIKPTIVAGASMGSVVGVFYASGYSPSQIYDIVKKEKLNQTLSIVSLSAKKNSLGISSHKDIQRVLQKYIKYNSFEQLNIPLYVSVANLTTGKSEYVSKDTLLLDYVLASSSIPMLFQAVEINDMLYVDGGLLNNFPAQPIRNKCRYLIGVNVEPNYEFVNAKKIKDVLFRTLQLITYSNSIEGGNMCDVLISPRANEKFNEMSFKYFDKIYMYGYEAMKKYLDENPHMVKELASKK